MKRLFVVALMAMAMVACTRTAEVTAPEEPKGKFLFELPATDDYVTWEATSIPTDLKAIDKPVPVRIVETEASLEKSSDCSASYGVFSSRWSFVQYATRWPNPNPPLIPSSATNVVIWYFGGLYPGDSYPQAFIPGVADLNGDLDCWTNSPTGTIRVTARKRGFDAANVNPVLSVYAYENTMNTLSLRFVFKPGDINLQRRHADVNIDISNVTVTVP